MAGLLFYYFGDDEAYFKTLQGEFKRHTRLDLKFTRIYESNEARIQSLFLKVFLDKPSCVFIDFSKNTQDYLHLARLIARTSFEHKLAIIGLVDYLSPLELMRESNSTGVHLTHIKSAETYDVIFGVTKLIAPQEIGEHGFAVAQLKDETVDVGVPCKVGYLTESGLHIETDHQISKGDRIKVNHFWLGRKYVPSQEMFVSATSNSNLFYQFKTAADVDFVFIDEFIPAEGMDGQTIKEKQNERNDLIQHSKKQLSKWIDDNLTVSLEKKAKVLIVDREFHFFQNQPRSDKYPYVIRCIPFFTEMEAQLERLQPQVIAISLDPDGPNAKNTNEMLISLAELLKNKFKRLNTFLVVFNVKSSSKELQTGLQYPRTMSSDAELSVDVMLRMAEIYDKKIASENEKAHAKEPKTKKTIERKVYFKGSNLASLCEIVSSINVKKISETDLIFTVDQHTFPIGANLHITKPVDMSINVQPSKNNGEYHGIIHCLGEVQKKELRRFVNSVFFRDHDAQVQAETDEFKKLNEKKLTEKTEAAKKEEEAKAKAEAEAAEKAKTEEAEKLKAAQALPEKKENSA